MNEDTFLKAKLKEAYELLQQALPYVSSHYERSALGFGMAARDLMNKIKGVLGIK